MVESPRVSIITPVWNGVNTLRRCLESVQSQTYANWEHIVIDGGSVDGTQTILRDDCWSNLFWISEPDRGIYHAMNKGIEKSKGDILVILNADDFFFPEALDVAVSTLVDSKAQATYGVIFRNVEGTIRAFLDLQTIEGKKPWLCMPMPHISVFAYRELYERWGGYNETYLLAADFDLVSRWRHHGVLFALIEKPLGVADWGGVTSGSGGFQVIREFRQIALKNGANRARAWIWFLGYWLKWSVIGRIPQAWLKRWLEWRERYALTKK